jgi:hypothetical protein
MYKGLGTRGDFQLIQIAPRYYILIPDEGRYSDKAFTMTGSDVVKSFPLEFSFGFMKLTFEHNTSTLGTDSTDELQITLKRRFPTYLEDPFFKQTDIGLAHGVVPDFSEHSGGDGFISQPCIVDLIMNSTATDLVLVEIQIKRLDA